MKNLIIFLLVLFLVGCAAQPEAAMPQMEPTSSPVLQGPVKVEPVNQVMVLDEYTFISNISSIVQELMVRSPELGKNLVCDLAITNSPTSEDIPVVAESSNGQKCTIMLIRTVDMLSPDSIWSEYAIDPDRRNYVASTLELQDGYPLLIVPEGAFDFEYYIRVFGHESFHMARIKSAEDCSSNPNKEECFIDEEVLAFQVQIELLEYYLKSIGKMDSYEFEGPFLVPGMSDLNIQALRNEHQVYFINKQGGLKDFLTEISYGQ